MQSRKPFDIEAQTIFLSAANKQFIGYITTKSFTDIYYLMRKYLHSNENARGTVATLSLLFRLANTTEDDCLNALYSEIKDYEDAVLLETALRYGFNCIVTRNTKDFKNSHIKIYTPTEFIDKQQ